VSGSEERIVALRRIPQRQEDRPSWVQKVEEWVSRHAVPFGTVQTQITVEYRHGQVVLIRLRPHRHGPAGHRGSAVALTARPDRLYRPSKK